MALKGVGNTVPSITSDSLIETLKRHYGKKSTKKNVNALLPRL